MEIFLIVLGVLYYGGGILLLIYHYFHLKHQEKRLTETLDKFSQPDNAKRLEK